MERTERRAIQREIYSQVARRFGVKSFKRTGSVSVTEEWMADGSVSRTTKIDESNPGDAELLIKMLSLAPPQDDSKQQPVVQTPSVEKPKADTPVSPKGDKAEMPGKKAEQAPGMPEDDQEDIQDRVLKNSHVRRASNYRNVPPVLDDVLADYLDTALWSSMDNETPMDQDHSVSDLAPEDRSKAEADCASFLQKVEEAGLTDQVHDNVGHDFWLTRNGHGAGFWDGDYPKEVGDKLTEIAKSFGSCDMYVGDDQKIYLAMKRKTADKDSYAPPFSVGDLVQFDNQKLLNSDGRGTLQQVEWAEAGTTGIVINAPKFGQSGDLGQDMTINIAGEDIDVWSYLLKKTGSQKTAGYSTRNGTKSEIQSIYSILELASTNDPGFKKPSFNEINDAISIGDNGTVTVFVGTLNGHPFGPDDYINSPGLDNSDGAWYELDGYYDQQETAHKRKTGSKKTITMANKKIGMKLMANEPVEVTGIDDTTLQTWFERDRAHVALVDAATEQNTIVEWWDEAVAEAVEDGFLDPRDYHQSAYDYAKQNGLLKEVAPKEEELGEDIFE